MKLVCRSCGRVFDERDVIEFKTDIPCPCGCGGKLVGPSMSPLFFRRFDS